MVYIQCMQCTHVYCIPNMHGLVSRSEVPVHKCYNNIMKIHVHVTKRGQNNELGKLFLGYKFRGGHQYTSASDCIQLNNGILCVHGRR